MVLYLNNSRIELINDELEEINLINKRMKRGSYLRMMSPNTARKDDGIAEMIADQDLQEESNRIYESKKYRKFKKDMILAVASVNEEIGPLETESMSNDMAPYQYSDLAYSAQGLSQIKRRTKRGSHQRAIVLKSI